MTSKKETEQETLDRLTEKQEKTNAMTVCEWSLFDKLQKKLAPEKFKARRAKEARASNIERAKKLSTDDLISLIQERNEGYVVFKPMTIEKES